MPLGGHPCTEQQGPHCPHTARGSAGLGTQRIECRGLGAHGGPCVTLESLPLPVTAGKLSSVARDGTHLTRHPYSQPPEGTPVRAVVCGGPGHSPAGRRAPVGLRLGRLVCCGAQDAGAPSPLGVGPVLMGTRFRLNEDRAGSLPAWHPGAAADGAVESFGAVPEDTARPHPEPELLPGAPRPLSFVPEGSLVEGGGPVCGRAL